MYGRSIAAALSVLVACGGGGDGGGDATITGFLANTGGQCGPGVAQIEVVREDGAETFDVAADCTFSATLKKDEWSYVRFLSSTGSVLGLLTWEDPTVLNDGRSLTLTSWVRLPADRVHDLDEIFFIDWAAAIADYPGTPPTFTGMGGTIAAEPFYSPINIDSDDDGIPDEHGADYRVGTDTDGDAVPEVRTPAACDPANAGPLFGRLNYYLDRPDVSDADRQTLMDNAASLPPEFTLTDTGFQLGPIPIAGAWIQLASDDANVHQYMADANGDFEITTVPEGVKVAKVYLGPGDDHPLAYLPLCNLQTSAGAVTDANSVALYRIYPSACHMDEGEEGIECGSGAAAHGGHGDHDDHGADDEPVPVDHRTCGSSNAGQCCLDYDGTPFGVTREPHNDDHHLPYLGSTCHQYVLANCCAGEGGDIKGFIGGRLLPQLSESLRFQRITGCHKNHRSRNCQNVDLTANGLVLSFSEALRDAHEPSPSTPLERTIGCGEEITLYHWNNTCQNNDKITNSDDDCGFLTPRAGTLVHPLTGPANDPNIKSLDLVFKANADHACDSLITSQARGFTQQLRVRVACDGPPPPTGACCHSSGNCIDNRTQEECEGNGGAWTEGAACIDIVCGACCEMDDTCTQGGDPLECEERGGDWLGLGDCSTIQCANLVPAVRLDYALGTPAVYEDNEIVTLCRISGGRVGAPDACDGDHLHAETDVGIFIDGINGPYTDQAPTVCGFGKIVQAVDDCPAAK